MQPIIDHIQITVQNLDRAEKLYDRLLPILGFDLKDKGKGKVPEHDFEVIEYYHPVLVIGFNSPRAQFKDDEVHRRKPGAVHHIAFKAKSNEHVNQLYTLIKTTGVHIVEPPRFYPQHGENYYALFFKDSEGIKWEIVHEPR